MTSAEAGDGATGPGRDPGGWRATSAQGLLLARWTAGELAAQWVTGLARWAWLVAGLAVVVAAVSLPVDPDWPFVTLGVLLLLGAAAFRLTLALASWLLRRLALPRRARHLRAESAAARHRVRLRAGAVRRPGVDPPRRGVPVGPGAGATPPLPGHRGPAGLHHPGGVGGRARATSGPAWPRATGRGPPRSAAARAGAPAPDGPAEGREMGPRG